jgi:hypothetical protein
MRFEMRLKEKLAAVFIQLPWNQDTHQEAISEIRSSIQPVVTLDRLKQFSVSNAIKNLDTSSVASQNAAERGVKPQLTRLSSGGASVQFATTSARRSYLEYGPVREVRRALKPADFRGLDGIFLFSPTATKELQRDIKIHLYGQHRRIRLLAQMTAQEVWEILRILQPTG